MAFFKLCSHFQYIEKTLDCDFLKKYSYKSINWCMDMTSSKIWNGFCTRWWPKVTWEIIFYGLFLVLSSTIFLKNHFFLPRRLIFAGNGVFGAKWRNLEWFLEFLILRGTAEDQNCPKKAILVVWKGVQY